MINCELIPLPDGQEKELRQWFEKPAFDILVKVVESQQKSYEAKALAEAVAAKDFPAKASIAGASLETAKQYATFREILQSLVTSQTPFTIAKLS